MNSKLLKDAKTVSFQEILEADILLETIGSY